MSNKEILEVVIEKLEGVKKVHSDYKKEGEVLGIESSIRTVKHLLESQSAPIKEGEESEPKRCRIELHVESFFGNSNIQNALVSFDELVNLVATYQPSGKVLSEEEKGAFAATLMYDCYNDILRAKDFLSRYTITENK